MKIYTIGYTGKSAQQFFDLLIDNNVNLLLDVRLNNDSQLAGFTKKSTLDYILKVHRDCKCEYSHEVLYAPTKEIYDNFKKKQISWEEYKESYTQLIKDRDAINDFLSKYKGYESICLLCSESVNARCHRQLLAEIIKAEHPGTTVENL